MKGNNWKEKRKLELIRHINSFMVGIVLILIIGMVGSWDIREVRPGEVEIFIASTTYIVLYGVIVLRRRFEGE